MRSPAHLIGPLSRRGIASLLVAVRSDRPLATPSRLYLRVTLYLTDADPELGRCEPNHPIGIEYKNELSIFERLILRQQPPQLSFEYVRVHYCHQSPHYNNKHSTHCTTCLTCRLYRLYNVYNGLYIHTQYTHNYLILRWLEVRFE